MENNRYVYGEVNKCTKSIMYASTMGNIDIF